MKRIIISGMFALLVLLSSCAQKEMLADDTDGSSEGKTVTAEKVIGGLNKFSFDMYRQLNAGSEDNEFISPLSISSALAMTYAGAKSTTAAAMKNALHFGPQNMKFHKSYGHMLDSLSSSNGDFEINIANAIWVQKAFPLLEKYSTTVKDLYKSESREMDFLKRPEASRKTINQWVENKTNDRIKELLPGGVIDADTRMILTNAVYFNAEWYKNFNKQLTNDETFYLLDGSESRCSMMYQRSYLAYSKTRDLQIVEIPYKGRQYAMMVLLPTEMQGLEDLVSGIDTSLIEKHDKNKSREDILLYIPKIKMDSDYELKPPLSALGMGTAFSDAADFSGMTGKKDLKISSVIHKAFIEVDEFKTEAAAATAVVMKLTSAMPSPVAPITFRADHPFVFMIRHIESGAILFMGQITNPE